MSCLNNAMLEKFHNFFTLANNLCFIFPCMSQIIKNCELKLTKISDRNPGKIPAFFMNFAGAGAGMTAQ